ncbi:MAG: ParM/StbA family protein [Burkholderiales bacterium]|nr:ParM/StbA family protein [Burkholderiales bacterium]
MSVLILDAGNSIIKAKIARRERGEVAFPHAMKPLTEMEYENILSRSKTTGLSPDYLRINGQPFVVGDSAERHGVHTQRTGSARYTRDYYGLFAAAVLVRLYERGREVSIFGSHPPGDVKFRQDLMESVIGDWDVETQGRERHFRVTYANTFDEPVGGLMNVLLTEDGQHYQHTEIGRGRSLVIDIGGFTTDYLSVNPGGEVDYSLARSVPIGIQNVVTDFEESFRANNLEAVKDTPVLPPERIRRAIATGVFEGGGRRYFCDDEAKEATNMLLNRIADTYQQIAGGSLSWDAIILTGGGSALLYQRLLPVLNHENIILADDIGSIHLANVRGGLKLWRLYEALQVL